jgi:hypothetical protein
MMRSETACSHRFRWPKVNVPVKQYLLRTRGECKHQSRNGGSSASPQLPCKSNGRTWETGSNRDGTVLVRIRMRRLSLWRALRAYA